MATTNRKKTTASKSQTARKKTTNNKRKKSNNQKQDFASLHSDIIVIGSIAVMALLMLSNFSLCGAIGDAISKFFFGLFGGIQYILPIMIFMGIALLVSNECSSLAIKKVLLGFLCILMISTLAQMITDIEAVDLKQVYFYSSLYKTGGGIVGGSICKFLYANVGAVGSYIIVLALLLISLVLITETSFVGIVKKSSSQVYQNVKESSESVGQRTKALRERNSQRIKEKREKNNRFNDEPLKEPDIFSKTVVLPSENAVTKEEPIVKQTAVPDMRELEYPKGQIDLETGEILDGTGLDFADAKETVVPNIIEPVVETTVELECIEPEVVTPVKAKKADKPSSEEELTIKIHDSDNSTYKFPPLTLLKKGKKSAGGNSENVLKATAIKLQQTLENFGVGVTITDVSMGPSVTRYEMQPEQGVKVSKIVGLADDIKLNLAASDIRIEAPIPGKAAVGIEVPNKTNSTVMFRDLIDNEEFRKYPSDIAFAVGKDIGGQIIVTDIAKMPHLLIAGATGSGKSVCINTLIMSILYKAMPSDVKLIMIDPKVVELSTYNGIPHLLIPVVTDPKKASSALNWAVMEMTDRYKKFAEVNVRNLKGYNKKVDEVLASGDIEEDSLEKMPQIVIIVDELADLMMVAPGEVEDAIVRLSQLARAAGIHLVIATQRPSVNVITGLIKANVPSRIAFSVSSGVDSRTIIDMNGAEKLLGKGDMLFYPSGYQKPVRVQGAFISDKEVSEVVDYLKEQGEEPEYNEEISAKISSAVSAPSSSGSERDDYFMEAARFIIDKDKASIGMLQRVYKIGFNRAARIMDQLAEAGVVGPEEGTKPRKVIMSLEEFEQYASEYL